MVTKICGRCREALPLSAFNKDEAKSFGVQAFCRTCMTAYKAEHYKANKAGIRHKVKVRSRAIKSWFLDLRSKLACSACGFSHPATIDFHHIDGEEKDGAVTTMVYEGCSKETIMREIRRCIPLCANCHRIAHHNKRLVRTAGIEPTSSGWKPEATANRPSPL